MPPLTLALATRLRRSWQAVRDNPLLAAGTLALALGLAGLWWVRGTPPPGPPLDFAQAEAGREVPDFSLLGPQGTVQRQHLRGHWTYVYFGYTHCPDACPTTLAQLAQVREAWGPGALAAPRSLLVSLDPERDSPQVLGRYAAAFGPDTEAVTGDDAALAPLVHFFGVAFERHADGVLDHSPQVFLLDPQLRWVGTFPPGVDGATLDRDTRALMGLPPRAPAAPPVQAAAPAKPS
jgi:protein SCO1/2